MKGAARRRIYIDVGGDTCPRKGSPAALVALTRALEKAGLSRSVEVVRRGCFGLCRLAPNLYVEPDGVWYSRFTPRDMATIVRKHLVGGERVTRLIHHPKRIRATKSKKKE
ncbi:MAG: hypothetical protein COV76_08590 [Candidatus Omnitrophica bacterium CG11_big_fil_rev_8_21_14_0_20_64_10]|nr:MAG: hypothetical protein COV76_08590 [Candidatus Omnitrophica bacterium CG11_big_fil_rev_8_21_14_0_20_64_10]